MSDKSSCSCAEPLQVLICRTSRVAREPNVTSCRYEDRGMLLERIAFDATGELLGLELIEFERDVAGGSAKDVEERDR